MKGEFWNKFNFAFCLGNHFFIPASWDSNYIKVVEAHETQHAKDQRTLGLGIHPFVGLPLFLILYFFVFFPLGLAIFRTWFEYRADKAEFQYMIDNKMITDRAILSEMVNQSARIISGWKYFFSCPMFITKLFYNKITKKLGEQLD